MTAVYSTLLRDYVDDCTMQIRLHADLDMNIGVANINVDKSTSEQSMSCML